MSHENVEVMRRMYDAWMRNDPSLFDAMHPDIELHPDPDAHWVDGNAVYHGHQGVRDYMTAVYEAFADYTPQVEEFVDAGDKVVTLAIERPRGRASGVEVADPRTAHVWTMRDGQAVRVDLYLDRSTALAAVGLAP